MAKDEVMTIEMRKQFLITQGAMYRSGIVGSREKVSQGLGAESLTKSVLKQVGLAIFSLWRNSKGLSMTNLPTMLPIVVTGVTGLIRPIIKRPVLRRTLLLSIATSTAMLFYQRQKRKQTNVVDVADEPEEQQDSQDNQDMQ